MKPVESEQKDEDDENVTSLAGDVIGNTAYSQRFVLKILLKLANLDTLKEEILDKNFEDELCTLWDMTADSDVVSFLQKHKFLSLVAFALPVISSPRVSEILIGIVGNMCCQKDVVTAVMKMDEFLKFLVNNFESDDSLILIQLLRLVNSCLFLSDDNDVSTWINLFINNGYSSILYFILKNSSNKVLLMTAVENLNTICSYCNTEANRCNFFKHFITSEAIDSLSSAFTEITVEQNDKFDKRDLERVMIISLQIVLNIIGFDKSKEIYEDSKQEIIKMISVIINYYNNKIINEKEIDLDLIDIIDSIVTITNTLRVSESSEPKEYFYKCYSMWKTLSQITKSEKNSSESFEEDDKEELKDFTVKMKGPLSKLLCTYVTQCSVECLLTVVELISTDYEDIVNSLEDEDLLNAMSKRTDNYKTRLKR